MGKLLRATLMVLVAMIAALSLGVGERSLALPDDLTGETGEQFRQEEVFDPFPLRPPNTDSPRATLQSFLQSAREAIQLNRSGGSQIAIKRAIQDALKTLDLSALPPAVRESQLSMASPTPTCVSS